RTLIAAEQVNAEQSVAVGPDRTMRPACAHCQAAEPFDIIFVGILGMDRFATLERESAPGDGDDLMLAADQVHLDSPLLRLIEGAVLELAEVEIAFQLAVDPSQQVEVEGGGDAGGVVI